MKNLLIICGDLYHPREVITRGLKYLIERGYRIDYVTDAKDILTKDMLDDYDVIVTAKGNGLTDSSTIPWFEDGVTAVMPDDFRAYVERGGGYISLHAGNTFTKDVRPDMCDLLGCDYGTHPPQNTVTLTVRDENHPVMEDVKTFSYRDEHYILKDIVDDAHILFDTESDTGGRVIGGYTRELGEGRLCVLTPGHNYAVLDHPQFRQVMLNAIEWCAKRK